VDAQMFEFIYFENHNGVQAVQLPFDLELLISEWTKLRYVMVKNPHPEFSRTEWAYLIQFIDPEMLFSTFKKAFGEPTTQAPVSAVYTPVNRVGLWLPNNVSLLGVLVVVLLSLTGVKLNIKVGSRSRNLCSAFFEWLEANSVPGLLNNWREESVIVAEFDRNDARNSEMTASSDVRILFGSDSAASGIEALPHPFNSRAFYFGDKVSEAWIDKSSINKSFAVDLIKVFGIYGQAGCTSPKRVFIVDGDRSDAEALINEVQRNWTSIRLEEAQRHVASENVMATQWALAQGKFAKLMPKNSAVLILEPAGPVSVISHMAISIQWGSLEDALLTQPSNIQSIGYSLNEQDVNIWSRALAHSRANRFVPIALMHHFESVWDGVPWWKQLFNIKTIT
jgi:hypothetical protein